MDLYLNLGDNEKAIENFKCAANHVLAFDKLTPMTPYTAPLIDKMIYWNLITNQKGNQAYILTKQLDDKKYNILRSDPEFIEIYDELKKYAKEDV